MLGGAGEGDVEVAGAVAAGLDDQDGVELQALGLARVQEDDPPRQVRLGVRGHAVQPGGEGGVQLPRGDDGEAALLGGQFPDGLGDGGGQVAGGPDPGTYARRAHRAGRGEGRVLGPDHGRREVHDLGRGAVVDAQAGVLPAVLDVRGEDLRPGADTGRLRGLRRVADQGHRAGGAAAHQQPPGHGGQFLRLVDDDVPERPGAVGRRALGGAAVVLLLLALGEALGVDDVVGEQDLRLLVGPVLELVGPGRVRHVQHALRVGDLLLPLAFGAGAGHPVVHAEQFGRLVQQGHVGDGPAPGDRAADGGGVLGGQEGLGGGEEVGDQALRGEPGPQPVDGGPDLGVLGEFVADLGDVAGVEEVGAVVGVGADALGDHVGEGVEDVPLEVFAGRVVRESRGAGALAGDVDEVVVQHEHVPVVLDGDDRVGQRLPVADHFGEHVGHAGPALHGRRLGGVRRRGPHSGEQLADGGEEHAGLAQRGQHLADVAEEGRVGADDEDGALGEQFAVLVEEVGGAVQGDGGLAGAGAALDDEDTAVRGADDAVLVGLDGLHDVAHAPGACGVQRGEQHGVAGGVLVAGAGLVAEVEDLVVQRGDGAALAGDVPAAAQTHRGVAGGQVEGAGDTGAPVDEDGGAFGVVGAQPDAADVVALPGGEVDPAEAQGAVHRVERGEQPGALGDQDVPFQPGLLGGVALRERLGDGHLGVAAQRVHARVQPVDEFLLVPQFIVRKFGV